MRGGILIVGSLWWEVEGGREEWRLERLRIDTAVPVKVPIRYGRCSTSRGNTFTMTFSPNGPMGHGIVVPLRTTLADIQALLAEAERLWQAEQPDAPTGSIGASWGCVGVLFRVQPIQGDWDRAWACHFRNTSTPLISPVNKDGVLRIPWPVKVDDGAAADMDVILATATKAADPLPDARHVADAWCDHGYECYFFKNVHHGIRTPDDGLIWRRIQEKSPSWLTQEAYAEAAAILSNEQASGASQVAQLDRCRSTNSTHQYLTILKRRHFFFGNERSTPMRYNVRS